MGGPPDEDGRRERGAENESEHGASEKQVSWSPPLVVCERGGPYSGLRSMAAAACRAQGSHYDLPVQKYVLSELDSGQRVITERIPSVRSVALGFWIGAGSRDETPSKAGITHFIEHLLFKGTRSYTAQDIAEIFDGLGGELNAATSREHTVVYVRVADHHLDKALDVMTRHGLRAGVRRPRLRARGRARGDRDVRGHAARARPRPDERGGLRRPPARAGR